MRWSGQTKEGVKYKKPQDNGRCSVAKIALERLICAGTALLGASRKPSSVACDHLSRPAVAAQAQAITKSVAGRHSMLSFQSCTGWGLQSGQVAMPLVSSYLAFPSLHRKNDAVSFCCTFLGVASTGCYPCLLYTSRCV